MMCDPIYSGKKIFFQEEYVPLPLSLSLSLGTDNMTDQLMVGERTTVRTRVLRRWAMALESAFQFCLDPKRPCMTTMGCDRACSCGEGLGVSVNESTTGGSFDGAELVAMDLVSPGTRSCRGNWRRRVVCLASIVVALRRVESGELG